MFKSSLELFKHLAIGGAVTNLDDSCYSTFVAYNTKGELQYSDGTIVDDMSMFNDAKHWRPVKQSTLVKIILENSK